MVKLQLRWNVSRLKLLEELFWWNFRACSHPTWSVHTLAICEQFSHLKASNRSSCAGESEHNHHDPNCVSVLSAPERRRPWSPLARLIWFWLAQVIQISTNRALTGVIQSYTECLGADPVNGPGTLPLSRAD